MFFGQIRLKGGDVWKDQLVDVKTREKFALVPLAVLALLLGILPSLLFDKMNASILALVQLITG